MRTNCNIWTAVGFGFVLIAYLVSYCLIRNTAFQLRRQDEAFSYHTIPLAVAPFCRTLYRPAVFLDAGLSNRGYYIETANGTDHFEGLQMTYPIPGGRDKGHLDEANKTLDFTGD